MNRFDKQLNTVALDKALEITLGAEGRDKMKVAYDIISTAMSEMFELGKREGAVEIRDMNLAAVAAADQDGFKRGFKTAEEELYGKSQHPDDEADTLSRAVAAFELQRDSGDEHK